MTPIICLRRRSLTRKQKEIIRKWIAQGADFGTWEGATDGLDELASKSGEAEYIPGTSSFFEELSQGLKPLPQQTLDELSAETGLLVRPIGLGSPLVEVRLFPPLNLSRRRQSRRCPH